MLLSKLIQKLQIMNGDALLDVADVAKVEFTDEHLVEVQQVEGLITIIAADGEKHDVDAGAKDFLLSSKEPFTSEEKLTITLVDGRVIVVGVTDDYTYTMTTSTVTFDELWTECGLILDINNVWVVNGDYFDTTPCLDIDETNKKLTVNETNYSKTNNKFTLQIINANDQSEEVFVDITVDLSNEYDDGVFLYTIDGGKATIVGISPSNTSKDVTIKSKTADNVYDVVAVSAYVAEADGGHGLWAKNAGLENITFDNDSALTVGQQAFYQAGSELVFRNSGNIKFNADSAFEQSNITSVTFENQGAIDFAGKRTFLKCVNLTSVVLNNTGAVNF